MELHGTFDPDSVLAMFRDTGSFDPDVLDTRLNELLHRAGAATRKGTLFLVLGCVATATLVGAPVGVALIRAGWWLRRAGARHVRTVRRAFDAYTHPGSRSMRTEDSKPRGDAR